MYERVALSWRRTGQGADVAIAGAYAAGPIQIGAVILCYII